MRGLALAALVGLASTSTASPARADAPTEQASRAFRAGTDAYARHDFREAAHQFEKAYRTAPRGAAVYNAGLAWEGAGELARAADDYAAAVGNGDTSAEQRSDAASRLKALEARVARLVVTGPADARVTIDDGADVGLPLATHLAAGHHDLNVAFASGATSSRSLDARGGVEQVVRLSEPTDAAASASKDAPAAGAGQDSGDATRRMLAWVALGGTVVATTLAVYFYEDGVSALNGFTAGHDTSASQRNQALSDRTASGVFWGFAGAFAATAVVLYITSSGPSPAGPSAPSASLRVGPAAAALRVTF